jgi:hypothetical protein
MAFDPKSYTMMARVAPAKAVKTWQEAKEYSLTDQFPKQLAMVKAKNYAIPASGSKKAKTWKGPKNPGCWVQKKNGELGMSWRIANKPIYWTDEAYENRKSRHVSTYLTVKEDVVKEFQEMRDYIASGAADELIRKCFERPRNTKPKKKKEKAEK